MKYATRSADLPDTSRHLPNADSTSALGGITKRVFDVIGAILAIVLLSPLLVMLALLVKLSDGGSVFFRHPRVGRNGETFKCLKFRTMAENSEEILAAHLAACPEAREEWKATRKLKNDPRITRVGAVLRKLSLDELPQLFNILRGDMSFVGPRPVVREGLDLFGNAAAYYLRTRPGLTGLWQISGRNDVPYGKRVDFDQQYVENWSLTSDLIIIIRTLPAVISSRGSY